MNENNLENNILATLVYYDIFDFPLKKNEVFERLISFKHSFPGKKYQTSVVSDVENNLNQLVEKRIVAVQDGCYFLFERNYLVPLRLKKEKLSEIKMRKTFRAVWWLRFVPYLKAVFASGSLGMRNTDELSDLDVLIVAKSGRIWLTRIFVLFVLSLFRVRRKASDRIAPDKICPNHFVTDDSLQIQFKSIYNAETYANLIPIYIKDANLIEKFKKENNWVLDYVCEWGSSLESKHRLKSGFAGWVAGAREWILNNRFGDYLEKIARNYQSKKIANNPLTGKPGGRIVFNDQQLEFHPLSIEEEIVRKYNYNLEKLGLSEFAHEENSGFL